MKEKKVWMEAEFQIIEIQTKDVITSSTNTEPEDKYEGEIDW